MIAGSLSSDGVGSGIVVRYHDHRRRFANKMALTPFVT